MRLLYILLIFVSSSLLMAQNNSLVIRDNAFIVLNGGTIGAEAVFVVNQSHPNGIITSGTGGNIITQGEFDYVKWNSRTGSGNYTIPFTTDVGLVKIPLSINVGAAGTGTGYMALSTWDVSTGPFSFNNTPWPSAVNHMAGANGQADVSDYAVDRFWIIDVRDPLGTGESFTTLPSPTISFGFNPLAAETGDGNLLAIMNLGAQQYNGATNKWHGWFSAGTPNGIYGSSTGTAVTGVAVPAGTWYRTWTLADYSEPLPVELKYFDGVCVDNKLSLKWETDSELNNDYFEILKSSNGVDFYVVKTISSSGTNVSGGIYSFVDPVGSGQNMFYQLVQVDLDGARKEYPVIQTTPCGGNEGFKVYGGIPGELVLEIESDLDEEFELIVYDALGKQLMSPNNINTQEGFNRLTVNYESLAFGNYMVVLQSKNRRMTQKLILR